MIKVFNIKLDSYSFTGTAVIVGYLLTNEFDVLEQAALGAWFNVVGDILASNSSFSAILEEQSDNFDLEGQKDDTEIDLETIDKAIDKLKESIEKIKKKRNLIMMIRLLFFLP